MIIFKKSFWALMTVYMSIWLVIVMVAGTVLEDYKMLINGILGLPGYRVENVATEDEDLEHFKSKFVKKDANGNVIYVTDADGYVHQAYDDDALLKASTEKAMQVQREGTTILWNSDDNGLPLSEGDKVSLFSHSSVAWGYSGGGSGKAFKGDNMKDALTKAGLSVNGTLWDFYSKGAGKDYVRDVANIHEVPWNVYTGEVKNSFASYGDAAIIVLTRVSREGSVGGAVADIPHTGADTPTGDYLDLSAEEEQMINEVIAAKNAGTFKKVIVLLNTPVGLYMDSLLERRGDIDCCMWVGQTGTCGLNEVGNILAGKSIPSGHLADTLLFNTRSTPAYANSIATAYLNAASMNLENINRQGVFIVYAEGIYVGYKYYETRYEDTVLGRGNATSNVGVVNSASSWVYSDVVAFPFGHGDSYTTFEYSNYSVVENADGNYEVTLTVTNTGSKKGSDAVQIYVQKPYTDYDIMWGIEQASVNLAGFAKTPELAPGESVDVTIVVEDDAFKTYDAYNKKTYIREQGEYYITAAQDAHEAVNNILAAKGYTPANTNGVMDAEGNNSLVGKFEFDTDDYETFSVSDVTGNPITNRFDDVDWNRYENKGPENVTYLSRNDWQGTYPTEAVKLSLTEKMVEELANDHKAAVNPEDKMPLFGQGHSFNLIDMKDLPYDHENWETLLNQLTLDEMIELLGSAMSGTMAMNSIAKPSDKAGGNPLGLTYPYLSSGKNPVNYPSPTVLAASYNEQLALEVGELIGYDGLHTGVIGLYAPGANIHRTPYSSRNFEYFSEDGFLSGMMAKNEIIGMESTGCYVNLKHFALNDQESYRHGVSIWSNEQAIREIYLAAYEPGVTDGKADGMMSAFNRLGTKWSGAHKGLLTDVLRGEWGLEGFVISDSAWQTYMGVIDGLMAGNDCILYEIDLSLYDQARTNPTVAKAVREATHRLLYVIGNSATMNGVGKNTKIILVNEWWQELIIDIQTGVLIVTISLLIITILAFILFGRVGREGLYYSSGSRGGKIIGTVFASVVSLALIAASIIIPYTLKNLPENHIGNMIADLLEGENPDGEEKVPSLKDQLEGEYNGYIFEAECSVLTSDKASTEAGGEGQNYPSGGMFINNMKNANEFKTVFNVTATEDAPAVLSLSMGLREWSMVMADVLTLTVNGEEIEISKDIVFPVSNGVRYFDWQEFEIAIINLKAGENTITLEKKAGLGDGEGNGLNFDYLALYTIADLGWTHEVGVGHSYGEWSLNSEPTAESAGEIASVCSTCRDYKVVAIPAISEANGYSKVTEDANGAYTKTTWTITVDGYTYTTTEINYPEGWADYRFEAECSDLTSDKALTEAGGKGQNYPSGGMYISNMKNAGNFKTVFNVTASKAAPAVLSLSMGLREWEMVVADVLTLTVNGEEIEISSNIIFPIYSGSNKWFDWTTIEIAGINLVEGNNIIVLEKREGLGDGVGNGLNFDYLSIGSVAELQWTSEVGVGHNYEWTVLTEPTLATAGKIAAYCETCRDYVEEEIPAVSADNGYVKTADDGILYGTSTWNYQKDDKTFTFTIKNYHENSEFYHIFEAESSKFDGSAKQYNNAVVGASNGAFLNKLHNKSTWSVTFEIGSNKATKAMLVMRIKGDKNVTLNNGRTLTVNGKNVALPNVTWLKNEDTSKHWMECEVVVIDLQMGKNTITFSNNGADFVSDLDYFAFITDAELSRYQGDVAHTCSFVPGEAVAPTCTESGLTAGTYCSICYKAGEAQEIIDSLGHADENGDELCDRCDSQVCIEHDVVTDKAVDATCTTSGLTEGSHCSKCGEILVAQKEVLAPGHKDENSDNSCDACGEPIGKKETYTFLVKDNDPFATENGGSAIDTGKDDNKTLGKGDVYENTYGCTFTFTVYVNEATTVELYVYENNGNAAMTVSSAFKELTLNGKKVDLLDTEMPKTDWSEGTAQYIHIATLDLQKGLNEITFVRTTPNSGANNVNIRGIKLVSNIPVTLADGHEFSIANGNNPFVPENGGSYKDETGGNLNDTRYGNGGGAELTVTLWVEEDTVVSFRLISGWRAGEHFGYYQDPNDGSTNYPYISYLKLNGETVGVTPSTTTYYNVAGFSNEYHYCELATIELKAGVANVISFRIAENNSTEGGDNVNFKGISIVTEPGVTVTLGNSQ